DYWLRRAADAMHAERRDEAVLLALEALPAAGVDARRLLAELIGNDFARLRETLRFASAPVGWTIEWDGGEVSIVDGARRSHRLAFAVHAGPLHGGGPEADALLGRADIGAGPPAARSANARSPAERDSLRLTSLQHVPIQREI